MNETHQTKQWPRTELLAQFKYKHRMQHGNDIICDAIEFDHVVASFVETRAASVGVSALG